MPGVRIGVLLYVGIFFVGAETLHTRIWTIRTSINFAGISYIDDDGAHKGIAHDVIDAVCAEAGIDCRIVRGFFTDCWKSNPGSRSSGGVGLFSRWYDACMPVTPTVDSVHTFQFSKSVFKPVQYFIYVLKGKSFNAADLRGQVIGIRKGIPASEMCLARHDVHYKHTANNTVFFSTPHEYLPALRSGQVDGIFGADSLWEAEDRPFVEAVPYPIFYCNLGGPSAMARKDSRFIALWNIGLTKLKNLPKWAKLCNSSYDKHSNRGFVFRCDGL